MSDESEQDQQNDQASTSGNADSESKADKGRKVHPLMMVFATGMVVLHNRRLRRNLLFGLTLAMLVMVLLGSVVLGESLARRPLMFTLFWALCFVLLFAVLALALYDLMRVRSEHHAEMRLLDAKMSAEMEKLRDKAKAEAGDEEEQEDSKEEGGGK